MIVTGPTRPTPRPDLEGARPRDTVVADRRSKLELIVEEGG
jgi:hypothetical protein